MRIGLVFSGVGGFELGLEWSGLGHTVWQVEQNEFCRRVLARHWPDTERFVDVRKVGAAELEPVDLICGGFPCTDISSAGKGAGLAGERSGLWFEYLRVIDELKPEWVVVENVASGAGKWVDAVCAALVERGYETLPVPLSAADVGAPHLRRRIFIVAHSDGYRFSKDIGIGSETEFLSSPSDGEVRPPRNTNDEWQPTQRAHDQMAELRESPGCSGWDRWTTVSPVRGGSHGISDRLDGGIDAEESNIRREDMPRVQRAVRTQEVHGKARGLRQIQGESSLLNCLHGVEHGEGRSNQVRIPKEDRAIESAELLSMWSDIKLAVASHQQELEGQQSVKPGNVVRDVPHGGSPSGRRYPSPTLREDESIPDRTHRLRALGNAVVPACAEVIGWMIREMECAL